MSDEQDPLVTGQGDEDGLMSADVSDGLHELEQMRLRLLRGTKGVRNAANVAALAALVNQLRTELANNLIPQIAQLFAVVGEEMFETDEIALDAIEYTKKNRRLLESMRAQLKEKLNIEVEWSPEDDADDAGPIDIDVAQAALTDLALMISTKYPEDGELGAALYRLSSALNPSLFPEAVPDETAEAPETGDEEDA